MRTDNPQKQDGGAVKNDPKRRLNIVLPESSWDRLERIKDFLEADTYTEVVKDSFRLMEFIIGLERSGSRLQVKDSNGELRTVEIFKLTRS